MAVFTSKRNDQTRLCPLCSCSWHRPPPPGRAVTVGAILAPRHACGHVTRVAGVDSKLAAAAPSVRARRDRKSPRALWYGSCSVTGSRAPMAVVGPGP